MLRNLKLTKCENLGWAFAWTEIFCSLTAWKGSMSAVLSPGSIFQVREDDPNSYPGCSQHRNKFLGLNTGGSQLILSFKSSMNPSCYFHLLSSSVYNNSLIEAFHITLCRDQLYQITSRWQADFCRPALVCKHREGREKVKSYTYTYYIRHRYKNICTEKRIGCPLACDSIRTI